MNYLKYFTLLVVFLFLSNTTVSAAPTGENFIRDMINTNMIDNITITAVDKVVEVAWVILIIVFGKPDQEMMLYRQENAKLLTYLQNQCNIIKNNNKLC